MAILRSFLWMIILLELSSCLLSQKKELARSTVNTNNFAQSSPTPEPSPTFDPQKGGLHWYFDGNQTDTLTINQNYQSVAFLKGPVVNNFLTVDKNFTYKFCLVLSYSLGAASTIKQLRLRAVPVTLTNMKDKTKERMFRIDLSTALESKAQCQGSISNISDPSMIAYQLTEVCPNCSNIFYSAGAALHQVTTTDFTIQDATKLPITGIDPSALILRINPASDTENPTLGCTMASCKSKGYDCCIDGQCLKDGQVRPGGSSLPHYAQAIADITVSPANFIYWPDVFYVCPGKPIPSPAPSATPDSEGTARAELENLIDYYYCLSGAELTTPDYTLCKPSLDLNGYNTIKDKIWTMCECGTVGTPAPEDPANTCPLYGLLAYDTNGILLKNLTVSDRSKIFRISCRVPPINTYTPYQDMRVKLPTRSVPHRFFKEGTGDEVTDLSTIFGTPEPLVNAEGTPVNVQGTPDTSGTLIYVSEGEPFFYLDEASKAEPNTDDQFNINSIFGQMLVNLSAAIPAKVLYIENDQTYVILTLSGAQSGKDGKEAGGSSTLYTPCPMCPRDSWFTAFTAHPPSEFGTGLQSIGHTTMRDNWSTNLTAGNYEDTIWGRACWVPPTMIPFSHKARSNADLTTLEAKDQRKARLKTQAAYYVNGYQRDWFGFNKGAVIGSFDGVKWFAIGKNRKVKATSNKLFLAINAPFADLASDSTFTLQVIQDDGTSKAPAFDYDPAFSKRSAQQNEAATCQFHHLCVTDSDCITNLGWEYSCVNVSSFRTLWPKFDASGKEQIDQALNVPFSKIIQSGSVPGNSNRCVYRGAGAPCAIDYYNFADLKLRKYFACAPNFYCASISDNAFNERLSREPNPINTILFGQGSHVLGRPLSYIGADDQLPDTIKDNILANAALKTDLQNPGICRPGKSLTFFGSASIDVKAQHQNADAAKRTDYISQIASCDSSASGNARVHSCPILNADGDYYYTATGTGQLLNSLFKKAKAQNECGQASLLNDGSASPFAPIEADPLLSLFNLPNPTLVRDACLRRAGAVCHSDYDCVPNRFHSEQTKLFGNSYFGNTEAEKSYWDEYLVCAQGAELPTITGQNPEEIAAEAAYDITKNQCCREIGQPFTMYTEGDPTTDVVTDSKGLKTSTAFYSIENPRTIGRYSRYTAIEDMVSTEFATTTISVHMHAKVEAGKRPHNYQWSTLNDTGRLTCCGGTWVRKFADGTNNWLLTNRLSFNVENFACLNFRSPVFDTKPPRLDAEDSSWDQDLDFFCQHPSKKGCLLFDMSEADSNFLSVVPKKLDDSFSGTVPRFYLFTDPVTSTTVALTSLQSEMRSGLLSDLAPFPPRKAVWNETVSGISAGLAAVSQFMNGVFEEYMVLQLPSYINGAANIHDIYLTQRKAQQNSETSEFEHDLTGKVRLRTLRTYTLVTNGNHPTSHIEYSTQDKYCPWSSKCTGVCSNAAANPLVKYKVLVDENTNSDAIQEYRGWCVEPESGRLFVKRKSCDASPNSAQCPTADKPWPFPANEDTVKKTQHGFLIEFYPIGTSGHLYTTSTTTRGSEIVSMTPGNDFYYMRKFDRFELLGIPQIYYEPIYCNSNKDTLVKGIFTVTTPVGGTDRSAFENNNFSFQITDDAEINKDTTANPLKRAVLQKTGSRDNIEIDDIFSGHDFVCCQRLGQKVSDPNHCCSSFGSLDNGEVKYTCKLPLKTDLHVYFNRFVSSEGIDASLSDEQRLLDSDFNPATGYPKNVVSVFNKIVALGKGFCDGGLVFTGGAFGRLGLKPFPGRGVISPYDATIDNPYGIVSDTSDGQQPTNNAGPTEGSKGFVRFNEGRRWNHHLYCGSVP